MAIRTMNRNTLSGVMRVPLVSGSPRASLRTISSFGSICSETSVSSVIAIATPSGAAVSGR